MNTNLRSDNTPWTIDKLASEMRKAGWESMGDYVYRYPNGTYKDGRPKYIQLGLRDGMPDGRERWQAWAETRDMPPPF